MSKAHHFIVSGRVQGVWYRVSTHKKGQALELTGWVRNLDNGNVELVAMGDDEKINVLKEWLWIGPPLAKVTDVQHKVIKHEAMDGFEVRE